MGKITKFSERKGKTSKVDELRRRLSDTTTDPFLVHLNREWEAAKWPKEGNESQAKIYQKLFDLLAILSSDDLGPATPYVVMLFKKLALYDNITPLTGEDDEWFEISAGLYQNLRCSAVFKNEAGAYDVIGELNFPYMSTPITFPYTPNPWKGAMK